MPELLYFSKIITLLAEEHREITFGQISDIKAGQEISIRFYGI
jgi:hypothetical protein